MDMLLFVLFGAYMTYQIYKWKRRPFGRWFGNNSEDVHSVGVGQKELTELQKNRIRKFHQALFEVNDTPLEVTLNNFKMDINPDWEIAIWEAIAAAYHQMLNQHPSFGLEEKKEIYRLLLLRSNMSAEVALVQANLSILPEAIAKEVLNLYTLEEKPFVHFN